MTEAVSAPMNALVMARVSVASPIKISAPSAARGCNRAAFLPTTRTFCPRARRFFATTCPVLPLAPRTTYILVSILKLDAAGRVWAPGRKAAVGGMCSLAEGPFLGRAGSAVHDCRSPLEASVNLLPPKLDRRLYCGLPRREGVGQVEFSFRDPIRIVFLDGKLRRESPIL